MTHNNRMDDQIKHNREPVKRKLNFEEENNNVPLIKKANYHNDNTLNTNNFHLNNDTSIFECSQNQVHKVSLFDSSIPTNLSKSQVDFFILNLRQAPQMNMNGIIIITIIKSIHLWLNLISIQGRFGILI